MNTGDERVQELRAEMDRRTDRAFRAAPMWRTRVRRRGLVAVTVAILLAMFVGAHLLTRSTSWYLLSGLLPVALLMWALRVLTRAVAESGDGRLDEHDRSLRDRVLRRAFFAGPVLLTLAALYVGYTQDLPDLAGRTTQMLGVALVALGSFPTLLLAWILPDDDPEDLV